MFLAAITSTPLAILLQFELILAFIFNLVLIYAISVQTPIKMRNYRIILLNMAVSQLFSTQFGLGAAPEALSPLPAMRINGYFKFIGQTFGGPFTVIQFVFFYSFIGLCVFECAAFRYYTLKHIKFHLSTKKLNILSSLILFCRYIFFHFIIGTMFVSCGVFLGAQFFFSLEGLVQYAKKYNLPLQDVDVQNDVLVILNLNYPLFVPLASSVVGGILAVSTAICMFTVRTHRLLVQHFSASNTSQVHYNQQKWLTVLLIGQGSLPIAIPLIASGALVPAIINLANGLSPSKLNWEIFILILGTYPLLCPLLTIILTEPYLVYVKKLFRKMGSIRKRETSISILQL